MKDKYAFFDAVGKEWNDIRKQLTEIEQTWNAPFYLFHENLFVSNLCLIRECLGGNICMAYAAKANPWLMRAASEEAEYIEVCTDGELELCLQYEIPVRKIVLDGVLRTDTLLKRALAAGVRRFCVDSVEQMQQLAMVGGKQPLELLLRVSSENRFGMDEKAIRQCAEIGIGMNARIVGLQYYPGTQRVQLRQIRRELELLEYGLKHICKFLNSEIAEVQFGSGIGFPYFVGDHKDEYVAAVSEVAKYVSEIQKKYKVIYEVGRCAASSAGIYVTSVFQTKRVEGKSVAFCLGGTSHLQYPGGVLGIRSPYIENICKIPSGEMKEYMVCGALCNEADVLARNAVLDENLAKGDLLIFYGAGAYSALEAPNLFLAMEMPSILLYNKTGNAYFQDIHSVRGHTLTYKLLDDRM